MNKLNLRQIYNTPLLIKGAYFDKLQQAYSKDYVSDMLGIDDKDAKPTMEVVDGVAVIPVTGCIAYNVLPFEKIFFGLTDLLDIEELLVEALSRDDIEGIIMSYDTPGGFVTYVDELANKIANWRGIKPIMSYVPSMSASAGYYLASSALAIYAHRTALVGSIGVYMSRFDMTEHYKGMGIALDLIRAGEHKATWHVGKPMTDSEAKELQRGVDYLYGLFTSHVRSMRGNVDNSYLQGQDFYGGEAISIGLVDGVVSGIGEVIREIKTYRTLGG